MVMDFEVTFENIKLDEYAFDTKEAVQGTQKNAHKSARHKNNFAFFILFPLFFEWWHHVRRTPWTILVWFSL